MARKSKGRQKIEMTRMTKESNLLVTFSKRRSGLFKKASELCTLCGAEIAIIVFSPGKKVFSFGHPSVQSILDRFQTRDPTPNSNTTLQLIEAHRNASVGQLNARLTETLSRLEAEKKRGEELAKMRKVGEERCWWEAPVGDMGIEELEKLKMALEELNINVAKHSEKIIMQASSANSVSFFPASSSSYGGVGHVGSSSGVKDSSGLGHSMVPYGFALGY